MENNRILCPVCNSPKGTDESLKCGKCGFESAYCLSFLSGEAMDAWKKAADALRKQHVAGMLGYTRGADLAVTGDRLCLTSRESGKALLISFDGSAPTVLENTKKVCLSALYHVILRTDGTLDSFGDNHDGQRELGDLKDIANIALSSRCTYAVTAEGKVITRGLTPFDLSGWSDVKELACSENHVIGLTNSGRVLLEHSPGSAVSSFADTVRGWRNVCGVAAAAGYLLALHSDGRVSCAGNRPEAEQVSSWRDITALAADNMYAVGLSRDGRVHLAGHAAPPVDFGRSSAAEWENIALIAAGRAVIAGITCAGELKLAGNLVRNDSLSGIVENSLSGII